MKQTTLCFLVKGDDVLLAMKKRGFGAGKWNGAGGKLQEGESVKAAAARETQEEIGVVIAPDNLEEVGMLSFRFEDHNPGWEQDCHIFIARAWENEPRESEEMKPAWYPINRLPFNEMWIDDPHWLPLVLAGKKIQAEFLFGDKGASLLKIKVSEVA